MKDLLRQAGARFWLRNARAAGVLVPGLEAERDADGLVRLDILIEDGVIAGVAPAGSAPDGVDLQGGQVWPSPVDAHTHLDKGHVWPRARNPRGDFAGAIETVMADRGANWSEADVEARADFAIRCAYAHGTVAIRTHIDTYLPRAHGSWRTMAKLRDRWAGKVALQMSSIAPLDRFLGDDGETLANLVADTGGVLGMVTRHAGHIHEDLPTGFLEELDHFFGLAEARGLDIDLHVDESGESGARALREVALTALRRGFKGRIQCGHCCSLSIQPEDFARETIARVAEAGISIVVLPMCNMYLQDRSAGRTPRWRGVTLVHDARGRHPRLGRFRQYARSLLRLWRSRHDGGLPGGDADPAPGPSLRRLAPRLDGEPRRGDGPRGPRPDPGGPAGGSGADLGTLHDRAALPPAIGPRGAAQRPRAGGDGPALAGAGCYPWPQGLICQRAKCARTRCTKALQSARLR